LRCARRYNCSVDLGSTKCIAAGFFRRLKLERQIASTDRTIDDLVCELYGITDEEWKISEE